MAQGNIELFSDYFAHETNALTRIDARIKLIFTLATLALMLAMHNLYILLLVSTFCLVSLISIKIPPKVLLIRYTGPLAMAFILIVLQGLFFGKTPLYSLSTMGFTISIFDEGLEKGFLIGSRVIAGVSLMILLSMTTPANKLLSALKSFNVPDTWLELVAFTYRYIFVFIEEAQNIMDSQRLRLGYRGLHNSLRSWGVLVGSLLIRAYDQANATHTAMLLRGYNGKMHIQKSGRLTAEDKAVTLVLAIFYLLLLAGFIYGG